MKLEIPREVTGLLKNKINSKYFNIFFLIFSILIILSSSYFYAYLDFFLNDFLFAQHAHRANLDKKFLEIIPNAGSFTGIATWVIEPHLNFIGKLNYDLSNRFDYLFYISIFRVLELSLIIFFAIKLDKEIKITDLSVLTLIYIVLLSNFNRYDHESYVNFPILIFCFFHVIALNVKNKFNFLFLNIIGNGWAYLINPIYFFNVCFFPLIFFLSYYLYNQEYKRLLITLFANLPFTILFILISMGTSRFALSENFIGSELHRNFTIFNSENYLILSIIFFIFSAISLIKKNNFYSWFFLIFTITTTFLGYLYIKNLEYWKLPPPYQFEYSIQYFLIIIFYMILKNIEKKFFYICLLALLPLFIFHSIFFINKFNYLKNEKSIKLKFIDKNNNFQKSFFWTKYERFPFQEDLSNKRVFIDLPNEQTKFSKSLFFYDSKNSKQKANIYTISKKFNGSFWDPFFWNNNIAINFGYSHILNINNFLAYYFSSEKLERQNVPRFKLNYNLINFFQFDYILTDIDLEIQNNNKFIKSKIYDFDDFKLYLFKISENKNQKSEIKKINLITNKKNYKRDIFKFNNELFLFKKELQKVKNINYFCNTTVHHHKKKINLQIYNPVSGSCLAIIPFPFSFNNVFVNSNNSLDSDCKTFKVQYYFHGCIIKKKKKNLTLKKNNLLKYPLGSLKDFNDFKKVKYYEKK